MARFFRKSKRRLIEINLAPKRKRHLLILFESFKQADKLTIGLASVSLISFLGIFIEESIFNTFLERKNNQLKSFQWKIRSTTSEINRLKRQLTFAEKKFKNFYIPHLKEKVFFIWYYQYGFKKSWQTINKFFQISKGWNSIAGFKVYPNPFNKISNSVFFNTGQIKNKIIYQPIKTNVFSRPSTEYKIGNSFYIIVYPIVKDRKVKEILSKIKDKTIKANLILQYSLLSQGFNKLKFTVPQTIVFPLNIICVNDKNCHNIISDLKNFCSKIYIHKEFRKEKFFLNTIQPETVLEGVCIKYTF